LFADEQIRDGVDSAIARLGRIRHVTGGRCEHGLGPDDVVGRLDLRWVGVYREDADSVRVSITFWDPVRRWMLPSLGDTLDSRGYSLIVISRGLEAAQIFGRGRIHATKSGRWTTTWYDGGSLGVLDHFETAHPDPYTFLVWLPAPQATGIGMVAPDFTIAPAEINSCACLEDSISPSGELDPA
jgi:hypothetical protein